METKTNLNRTSEDSVNLAKLLFSITSNGLIINYGSLVLMFIQEAADDDDARSDITPSVTALHCRR